MESTTLENLAQAACFPPSTGGSGSKPETLSLKYWRVWSQADVLLLYRNFPHSLALSSWPVLIRSRLGRTSVFTFLSCSCIRLFLRSPRAIEPIEQNCPNGALVAQKTTDFGLTMDQAGS